MAAKNDHKTYISLAPFHMAFFTYNGRPNVMMGQGFFEPVVHANEDTCPAGRVLKETGRKLRPGINPGVTEVMVSVYDKESLITGFIFPNDPVFAPYNDSPPITTYTPSTEQHLNSLIPTQSMTQSESMYQKIYNPSDYTQTSSSELQAMRQKIFNQSAVSQPSTRSERSSERAMPPGERSSPGGTPMSQTTQPKANNQSKPSLSLSRPNDPSLLPENSPKISIDAPFGDHRVPIYKSSDNSVVQSFQSLTHIQAGTSIMAGTNVVAGASIYATTAIQAGTDIKANGTVHAGTSVSGGFVSSTLYTTGFQQIVYDNLSANADIYINPSTANVFEVHITHQNLNGTIFCYLRDPSNPLHPVSLHAGQTITIIFLNSTGNTPSVVFQYESSGGFHSAGIMKLAPTSGNTITFVFNSTAAYETNRTQSLSL
jgi:hypothetical protein